MENKIITTSIPREDYDSAEDFSLDIGGSVIKLAYKNTQVNDLTGGINLVHFPREDIERALDYIEMKCLLKSHGSRIYVTGIGCNKLKETIETRLNVNLEILVEMSCLIEAFNILIKDQAVNCKYHAISEETKQLIDTEQANLQKFTKQIVETQKEEYFSNLLFDYSKNNIETSKAESLFPCLLVMAGSATGFIKVNFDETMLMLGGTQSGGRKLLGLGSLLTGINSYDELIDLASCGNDKNVDTMVNDLANSDGKDLYSVLTDEDLPAYSFGKAAFSSLEHFKREDLALALVNSVVRDMLYTTLVYCQWHKIQSVMMVGSIAGSGFMRDKYCREFQRLLTWQDASIRVNPKILFPEVGPYLGALGALTHRYTRSSKTEKTTSF